MTVLRALDARFSSGGSELVSAFSLVLDAGARAELGQPSARAASLAARMCAAIVKPTDGTIYVGEYETRLQAPQAKRRVGFVDARGFDGDEYLFRCEVAFVADVWGVATDVVRARAAELVRAFAPPRAMPDDLPYARATALALAVDVSLVVLDQPPPYLAERVRTVVRQAAILVTHVAALHVAAPADVRVPATT